MKGHVRCSECAKIIMEVDEVDYGWMVKQGEVPMKCDECSAKDIILPDDPLDIPL